MAQTKRGLPIKKVTVHTIVESPFRTFGVGRTKQTRGTLQNPTKPGSILDTFEPQINRETNSLLRSKKVDLKDETWGETKKKKGGENAEKSSVARNTMSSSMSTVNWTDLTSSLLADCSKRKAREKIDAHRGEVRVKRDTARLCSIKPNRLGPLSPPSSSQLAMRKAISSVLIRH